MHPPVAAAPGAAAAVAQAAAQAVPIAAAAAVQVLVLASALAERYLCKPDEFAATADAQALWVACMPS